MQNTGQDAAGEPADDPSSDNSEQSNSAAQDVSEGTAQDGADPGMSGGDAVAGSEDDPQTAVPAAGVINQTTPLEVVAQQESTRSYFLAQTLESTRTVPIVSANLPLDKGTTDEVAEPEAPAEGDGPVEDEGGDDSDESDPGTSDDASAVTPGVSAESTVVGSFEYRGITYAVEPGGESVAVVAADYVKLPSEFVEAQTIVLPSMVTVDGIDYYTVSRIADHAFAGINGSVAVAAQEGQDAGAPPSVEAQVEAYAHEDGAAQEPSEDGEATDSADPVSSEGGDVADDAVSESSESDSVAADVAVGITTVTIPASIVEIGNDAFAGCDTLQYVIVSEDNPNYSMYDGVLYDAEQTRLLLVPEGRLGAVRIAPSVTEVEAGVFSHCASVEALVADPSSAASQLLSENDFHNANGEKIKVITSDNPREFKGHGAFSAEYAIALEIEVGDSIDLVSELKVRSDEVKMLSWAASDAGILVKGEADRVIAKSKGRSSLLARVEMIDGSLWYVVFDVLSTDENEPIIQDLIANSPTEGTRDDIATDMVAKERATYEAAHSASIDTTSFRIGPEGDLVADLNYVSAFMNGRMTGTVSWTGGNAAGPLPGSVVKVDVTKYSPGNSGSAALEMLYFRSIHEWAHAGSSTRKLIGFRDAYTNSYIDVNDLYGGSSFFLSFKIPTEAIVTDASNIRTLQIVGSAAATNPFTMTIDRSSGSSVVTKIDWKNSTFVPQYEDTPNSVVTYFSRNGGTFSDPVTGAGGGWDAATYSTVGGPLVVPSLNLVRTNYMFTGWKTQTGQLPGSVVSQLSEPMTYYAQWAAQGGSLPFKITTGNLVLGPANDIGPNGVAGSNAYMSAFLNGKTTGTVSWTGGTSTLPAPGSIVKVQVSEYIPGDTGSAALEILYYRSITQWGDAGSDSRRLVGLAESTTGAYISTDDLYSRKPFSFTFTIPSSGLTTSTQGATTTLSRGAFGDMDFFQFSVDSSSGSPQVSYIGWKNSTFHPCYESVENAKVSFFSPNGGSFRDMQTGAGGGYWAATYSSVGSPLVTPSLNTTKNGQNFSGWRTEEGALPDDVVLEDADRKTFLAQWKTLSGTATTNSANNFSLSPTGDLYPVGAYAAFMNGTVDGTISWTGGDSSGPVGGSLITVSVNTYTPANTGSATLENLYYRSTEGWVDKGSNTKRIIGLRNAETGSFIGVSDLYGFKSFMFTIKVPDEAVVSTSGTTRSLRYGSDAANNRFAVILDNASGSLKITNMYWKNSPFTPVYESVKNSIISFYDPNGGIFRDTQTKATSTYNAATYSTIGAPLVIPSLNVTKDGSAFTGWFVSKTSSVLAPTVATEENNGKTYYAHWGDSSTQYYFLTFDKNDGAATGEMPGRSIPSNIKMTAPEATYQKAGSTVTAWNAKADLSGTGYVVGTEYSAFAANSTTVLYAKWEADTYRLSFDLKGGSFASGYAAPESYQYENGTISIPNPTRPGYEFMGWTGTGLSEATEGLTIDKHSDDKLGAHTAGTAVYERSYTATWRPYSYNVEFYDGQDGHTSDKIADDQGGFTYGTAKALAPANLVDAKPGYHVSGWKIGAPDSTERVNGATGSLTTFDQHAPTGDDPVQTVKLYAEWTPNSYSVKLHDTVAGNADQTQTGFKYSTDNEASGDKALAQTSPAFTRTAYEIAGWALEPSGSIVFEGETPVIASATLAANDAFPAEGGTLDLYAVWKPSLYTVTLNSAHVTSWDTTKAQGFTKAWDASLVTGGSNGAGTATNTYTVESGADLAIPGGTTETGVVLLPEPTADFYTFKGWTNVKDAADNPVELITYTLATDDVRYGFVPSASGLHASFTADAVWEEVEYPLTKMMVLDDGDTPEMPVAYEAGKYDVVPTTGAFDWLYTVSGTTDGNALPALPTLPGYTFTGWSSPDDIICKADGSDFDAADFPVKTGAYLKANKTTLAKPQYKLVAHFTRDHHALRLDMDLSDAKLPNSALSNGASEGWKKADGAGNVYTYVDTAGHDGWSRDIASGTIVLPVPERNGYKFTGWTVTDGQTVIAAVSGTGTADDPYTFKLPADKDDYEDFLMDYTLQAQWAQCDYSITLGNVLGHVKPTDGFATGAFESGSTQNVKTFKGAALGATTGITIGEPTEFVEGYATGFERWVTARDMTGVSGWTKVADKDAWWARSFTITQANVEQYFGAGSANTSGQMHDFIVEAEFASAPYTATLDFTAGKVLATTAQPETTVAGGAISDDERTRTGWSANVRDYDCSSDTIVLPKPTLYGYTFKGWEVSIDGGEYAAVTPATEGEHAGEYLLPHDSIGMRVYKPVWEKRTMKVQLHDNAASVGMTATPTAPGTPIDVVFGEPMPSVSVWPAVDGYDFTGYFDTAETSGGKQYYLADHSSANLWDKAPKDDGTAYDLYGRWMKRDVAGETPMPAKGADIALFAKDPADVLSVAFKATYNGTYTTTDDGRVLVSVDSYQFVDCSAESIYAGFQKPEGETERFLLGFSIPSTGSFIPFTRFIEREQFEFEVLASELVAGIEAPSLTLGSALKPGTVVAVYTKDEITPGPGPGGEPVDPTPTPGQELTTIWNANGGAFVDEGDPAIKTSTTTVKPEGQKTYATPPAKSALTRFGYDMVGWSKSKTHIASCDCAEGGEIPLFELTSVVPSTYYAHWKAKESTVQFDNNGGTPVEKTTVSGFAFGLSGTQLGVTEVGGTVLPAVPERTGYDFLGFFDAKTGGTQYFSSAGVQVRAWNKEPLANDPHVLYAQWAAKSGTGVTPTEPEKPNPVDPFPGIPTTPGTVITVVTKDPNNKVNIAAAIDGDADTRGTVIAGTYDGTVTYRTSKTSVPENYLPTGDDDVCVRLFTYSFDTQAVVKHFDDIAPEVDGKKQYLQGFEVPTTGSRVPLATLANGSTVEIIAKGSDLSGIEGETLASFAIRYTKMVPVYGPTPSIPLQTGGETWPVATPPNRTQVENIFDASMGRFGEGSTVRFQSVAAPYLGKLVFPTDDPVYNTAEGYHFDGWFTADGTEVTKHDAAGNLVRDAEGKLVAADTATVDSAYPVTYYAHYKQTNFNLTFAAGETAEYPADEYPISNVPAAMDAYAGQPVSTVTFPSTSTTAAGFNRKGFDFVGWFAADGTPYYLTTAASGADRDAYDAFLATNPTISSAVALTAKWTPITYTVVFRYDSGQSYVHKADNVTKTVKYGEVVADDFIPIPTNGGYTFNGWYASKSWATSSRVYDAKTGTRGSNYFTSDGRFKPTADAIPNPMEVFARFDVNASGITWYTITLETVDAAQGTVSNSTFPYNVTSADVMMAALEAQVNPKAGWTFDCLKEVTHDDDGNEVLTKVDFDRIPTGSTGDRTFRAFFVAKNDYKIDLNWGKKPEGVTLNADDQELWGEDLSLPVTVEMTEPIALPSEFEVEGHLGYTFLGWFPVNAAGEVEQGAEAVASVTPSALIGDPANENVTVFRYMALWKPKAYEVVFRYGENPTDEDFTVDVASYEDSVEMPVPATIANGKIFENWGAWHTDMAVSGDWKTWTSHDDAVPFATLVDEVLKHQPGAVDDLENNGRVTLYANWGERVGATLPLQVNILIDPFLAKVEVGDAWIGTSASVPVQVESLTYEMVQDAGDVPGTESILTDADNTVRTGDFALTVAAGDGTADALRIPLDGPGVVSRDLSGYGFVPFASDAALPVKYGLELPKLASGEVADLTPFTKVLMNPGVLLDKLDAKGDHVALPLAKLYYTIGLARDLPAEPDA